MFPFTQGPTDTDTAGNARDFHRLRTAGLERSGTVASGVSRDAGTGRPPVVALSRCRFFVRHFVANKIARCGGQDYNALAMKEQVAVQRLLREKFSEIQRGNPRYSLRAYARTVDVHVGALTYIINGKRNVSRSLAERIAQRLLLDPQERSELLTFFPRKPGAQKPGAPPAPAPKPRITTPATSN